MSRPDQFVPLITELPVDEDFVSEFGAAYLDQLASQAAMLISFDPDLFALRVKCESIHHLYEE